MIKVQTSYESERGCGYRKPGGIYLVSNAFQFSCGRLPVPLGVCPCCNQGVKPSRGFTWISPKPILEEKPCNTLKHCASCLCCAETAPKRAGLLWVGERFYPTPNDFLKEAFNRGVSKRISRIPYGLKPGSTVIYLAHRKGVDALLDKWPGIIAAFIPIRIEYVVKGRETESELQALVNRGMVPVKVVPCGMLPAKVSKGEA